MNLLFVYLTIVRDLKDGTILPDYVEGARKIKEIIFKDKIVEKALNLCIEKILNVQLTNDIQT